MLDPQRPIYKKTAAYGHFGRALPELTWENTDSTAVFAAHIGAKTHVVG